MQYGYRLVMIFFCVARHTVISFKLIMIILEIRNKDVFVFFVATLLQRIIYAVECSKVTSLKILITFSNVERLVLKLKRVKKRLSVYCGLGQRKEMP